MSFVFCLRVILCLHVTLQVPFASSSPHMLSPKSPHHLMCPCHPTSQYPCTWETRSCPAGPRPVWTQGLWKGPEASAAAPSPGEERMRCGPGAPGKPPGGRKKPTVLGHKLAGPVSTSSGLLGPEASLRLPLKPMENSIRSAMIWERTPDRCPLVILTAGSDPWLDSELHLPLCTPSAMSPCLHPAMRSQEW